MGELHGFLNSIGMVDLGSSGLSFTWFNNRFGRANIREKLDRGVANVARQCLFPRAAVQNLICTSSNHYSIVISTDGGCKSLNGFLPL